jgi:hypothetical protein
MIHKINLLFIFLSLLLLCCFFSCRENHPAKEKEIVQTPEEMDDQVSDNLKAVLLFAKENNGKINDSISLSQPVLVNYFYDQNNFKSIWNSKENWLPQADSMFLFIENSKYYGLYPEDYHFNELQYLRKKIAADSTARMDAITWTKAELMLTDAFIKTLKDLREGRLLPDSVSIFSKKDYADSFFTENLNNIKNNNNITSVFNKNEPHHTGYHSL